MTEQYTPTTTEVREMYVRADRGVRSREEYESEFHRWLAVHDAEVAAKAWDEGVTTALNYAKRQPDGITLKLETFDGDEWQNPYRKAVES